jgi:hypothetical protein
MSSATLIKTFTSPLNQSVVGLAAAIDAWFQVVGSVMLVDVVGAVQENQRSGQTASATLTVVNAPNGGQSLRCTPLIGYPFAPVDGQFAIWMANNPTVTIARVLDLTVADETSLDESLIVIYATGLEPAKRTVIVTNTGGSIPHLASGTVTVYDPVGTPVTVTMVNVSGVSWGAGVRGYASWDVSSGSWVGVLL